MFGYGYYNSSQRPQETLVNTTQSVAKENTQTATAAQKQKEEPTIDSTKIFAAHAVERDSIIGKEPQYVTLKNKNITVSINRVGGMIYGVKLNNYRSYSDFHENRDIPLQLYDKNYAHLDIALPLQEGVLNTKDYVFTPVDIKDSTSVTMQMVGRDSSFFAIRYNLLPGDNYMMNVEIITSGIKKHLAVNASNAIVLDWKQKIQQYEKGEYFENQYSTITYKLHNDDTKKISEHGTERETAESAVDWVAFKNQYFSSVLIAPKSEFTNVNMESVELKDEPGFLKDYHATMNLPIASDNAQATTLQFYFGPNSFILLKAIDKIILGEMVYDLEDLVYLGWPLFKWINRFFTIYVFDFLTSLGLPMGIVLLLITILLRVIVYVPTKKSFLSSAKMRVPRPKIDEISKKYPNKNDAMKKQQETMALYSQYGVSPMGGCLPALIQMPIWIAMFNFVPNAIQLRGESFLWIKDLSTYDPILEWNTNLWLIGDHLSLTCILFCVANVLYSLMTMRQQRDQMVGQQAEQMKMMQWMMFLMPVMFFFMFNDYSAGLNFYYFISLFFSAAIMWTLRKTTNDEKLLAILEKKYEENKNNPKKLSGLAARLQAMQEQQMELQRKREELERKRKGL